MSSGEFQIYVGDLDNSINDQTLMMTFQKIYPSVNQAKVITDPVTRESRGYGFVKFGLTEEGQRAMKEMQGKRILSKNIKIKHANHQQSN